VAPYVYKKGDRRRWYIGYRGEDGKPKQFASWARTKTEAMKLAEELETKAERVRLGLDAGTPSRVAFSDFATRYEKWAKTTRGHQAVLSRVKVHLRPFFGDSPLSTITAAKVRELVELKLAAVERGDISLATAEVVRMQLSAMLSVAIKWGLMRGPNPAAQVDRIRIPKRDPVYLEPSELAALIEATPHEWRNFVRLGMCAGLRRGELVGLKRDCVDLARGLIRVRWSYGAEATKSGKPRSVVISDELEPFLREQLAAHDSDWVFPGPEGKMLPRHTDLARYFSLWGVAAGIKKRVTPKVLRSTWATLAASQVRDMRFVQFMLGHSNMKTTTERYAALRAGAFAEEGKGLKIVGGTYRAPPRAAAGTKRKRKS
jgi:integrase